MTMATKSEGFSPDVPTSEEFSRTLGQVTWLMTLSKEHRNRPISEIESRVSAPLMFRQVRVFLRDKQPLAALTWAYVSPDVKEKLKGGERSMSLQDWRSGPEVLVVECISPLMDPQIFINQFMADVEAARLKNQ